jgi:hypothetical protein
MRGGLSSKEAMSGSAGASKSIESNSLADSRFSGDAGDMAIIISVDKPEDELIYIKNIISQKTGKPVSDENVDITSYSNNVGDIIINVDIPSKQLDAITALLSGKYGSSFVISKVNENKELSVLKVVIDLKSKK